MNNGIRKPRLFSLHTLGAVALTLVAAGAWAQDTTSTDVRHGAPTFETEVKNAQIVYVEGNDLVLKLENGKVEHLQVPSSEKFTIDGKDVTVSDLKPGTKLTQTITTTITPRYVQTVRTIKGKIWHVNAPKSVIISLPDGTNQNYNIPSHAEFTINGKSKTAFELKKGMKLEATIVTEEPGTVVERTKVAVGQAPVATPQLVGVLLIQQPRVPVESTTNIAAEHVDLPAAMLPNTGSMVPLAGLLGALSLATSLGLGAARKFFTA